MSYSYKPAFLLLAVSGLALGGCATASNALGLTKQAPNEFNILTNAPLVVPPEYNLRPPAPGRSSLQDNYSQRSAREAIMGNIDPAEPSEGEMVLLTRAGAGRADPEVRIKIDGQNSTERKTDALSDRILFWRNGQQFDADGNPVPLDAESERRRLESVQTVTGGGQVSVTRRPAEAKLPGL